MPWFSDLSRKHGDRTACCICGHYAAAGKLLACERESGNTVCSTVAVKKENLSDTKKLSAGIEEDAVSRKVTS